MPERIIFDPDNPRPVGAGRRRVGGEADVSEPTLALPDLPGHHCQNDRGRRTCWRAAQQSLADPRIVDANHLAYDVESYYVANGLPVADTALGIDASVGAESGDLAALGAYPVPYTVDLGATSRWLPLDGTFDDGQDWAPFQGSRRDPAERRRHLPGAGRRLRVPAGRPSSPAGSAMRLDGGDYFLTDELAWGAAR